MAKYLSPKTSINIKLRNGKHKCCLVRIKMYVESVLSGKVNAFS